MALTKEQKVLFLVKANELMEQIAERKLNNPTQEEMEALSEDSLDQVIRVVGEWFDKFYAMMIDHNFIE